MADIEIRQAPPTAFYIKVHDADNVAIIVNDNGLKAGTRFPDGLELTEHVPQGHKVALVDIPAESEIVRYGEVIGYAVRSIQQGSWVEESLVALPEAPPLNTLPLATRVPEPLPPLEGYTFEGYRNADGSVGTKNLLGITTSVHCVAGVVDYVVKIIERDLLPKYPNVDGVVGLNHLYGCGVAINAPAAVVPIRTIHNIALNPNFGGEVMVIGLGCEKLQPERLLALVSLIELENGSGRVAVPEGAPAAIESLAQRRGGRVLRLDRDGAEAQAVYESQPWTRDAAFAACRICARMGQTGERLQTLAGRGPRFVVLRREVPLNKSRGEVMQALAAGAEQAGEGVRVQTGGAVVRMAPLSRRAALRVLVEAADMEAAEELCAEFVEKVRALDGE